jgi:multisubunit Na+/H+ antiporter MnhB subunit
MDPVIVFACIFAPTFVLNMLSAGRDQLLFQTRKRASRLGAAGAMVAATMVLVIVGLPWTWALALVLPGPLGSVLGDWVGSGNWIVLRHRIGRLFDRN